MSNERRVFESIADDNIKHSGFDLSHERLLSAKMGYLYPVLLEEVLPTDTFQVNTEMLIKMQPLIGPLMHRVNAYMHYFFVPNRIVWEDWEEFITGGEDGTSQVALPTFHPGNRVVATGSLWDHLGLPTDPEEAAFITETDTEFSTLPFRGYATIWNEYYRDVHLQEPIDIETTNWQDPMFQLQRRAWEKDYFTSARPAPALGPQIFLPLEWSPVYQHATLTNDIPDQGPVGTLYTADAIGAEIQNLQVGDDETPNPDGTPVYVQNLVDPQQSNSLTINDLREANKVQEWLEKAMRGGSRYTEILQSFFQANPGDARLQRPEYLGGGKIPIVISEVLSSVGLEANGGDALGTQAGHGVGMGSGAGFKRTFQEHGYIFGILSVLPRTSYMNGVHKHWSRRDRFDYYWPEFADLGEQEIKKLEVFYDMDNFTQNDKAWGYQQRYAEYKYKDSSFHGDFRTASYDTWHMGRNYTQASNGPELNPQFIECNPTDRIWAVTDPSVDNLLIQLYHDVRANRPMPYFGIPSLV